MKKERKLYFERPASFSPVEGRIRVQHTVVRFEGRKKRCIHCKKSERKTSKGYLVETCFKCKQCDIALCKAPCFLEYHSQFIDIKCSLHPWLPFLKSLLEHGSKCVVMPKKPLLRSKIL